MHSLKQILITLIVLFYFSGTALGISEVTLNNIKRPDGAILFIIDGMGSSYYYPELTPYALDSSELSKARTQNLSFGTRIINISTPYPVTGIAHSVIVTGDSKANEEIVGYPDATIYDVTKQHGFINLAVMEKGDFINMREEQDMILFAQNNSIDEPLLSIQAKNPISDIYETMYDWKVKQQVYLNNKSGVERYSAYNKWGIDAANAVATSMIKNHRSQRFFLTVNIGAIDSGGHNLGDDDYIRLIEDLDRDIFPLYRTASENNIALFLTADHGMSFAKKNARRGGHSSEKYSSRQESLKIPLAIMSSNTVPRILNEEYGQQDLAPAILSVLDLPNSLQYTDGKPINIKNYASIFIKTDTEYSVSLWNGDQKVSENSGSEIIFTGLPLNTNITLRATGNGETYEKYLYLNSDKQFNFNYKNGLNYRGYITIILILIINITGLIIIKRINY